MCDKMIEITNMALFVLFWFKLCKKYALLEFREGLYCQFDTFDAVD